MKDNKDSPGSWKNINKKGKEYGDDIRRSSLGFAVIAFIMAIVGILIVFKVI